MANNVHVGQLFGPFNANEELYEKIVADSKWGCRYVKHLGIQINKKPTKQDIIVYINKKPVEIGKTGIYEIGNTEITSIYFKTDTENDVIVDYVIE